MVNTGIHERTNVAALRTPLVRRVTIGNPHLGRLGLPPWGDSAICGSGAQRPERGFYWAPAARGWRS